MRWFIALPGLLIAAGAVVFLVGAALPVDHVSSVHVQLGAPPDTVFAAISDPEAALEWRSDLRRVEILSRPGERLRWRETTSSGPITFIAEESQSPTRFVSRIDDADLPFGGRWVHELEPRGAGTLLTITEEGEVYNPIFRFISRFFLGHYGTLERSARDLANHFGSEGGVRRGTD